MTESARKPRILIVDDSTSVRAYVGALLTDAGYEVAEAVNGSEGLLRLATPPLPDVVLLDVEMPGLSGLELLDALGPAPRLYAVILFTTRSSLEQVAAGLDLGADDYVVKPFQEIELLARLRAAVRNSRHKRALARARQETDAALARLTRTQAKLVEQEKVGAVAQLAAGAAHHINNPLGFVMSNISTLERYASGLARYADDLASRLRALSPEMEGVVGEIEQSHRIRKIRSDLPSLLQETREGGQRIALIVQQLAQLELGLAHQKTAELDLTSVLRPLVEMLSPLAPEGTLVAFCEPEEPVAVRGSITLLNTALVALLKNACEALGSQPGEIRVSLAGKPETAEITICDSGAGVSRDHADSLFVPFFTTKTPDSHVGLGLTIAERFISGHGGRISIASDRDGTTVRVLIPRLSSSPQPDAEPSPIS